MSVFIDHDIQNWKRFRSGNMRHSSIPCGPRQVRDPGWSIQGSALGKDQNGAEIVHIGEGWAGDHQISIAEKKLYPSLLESIALADTPAERRGQDCRAEERARIVLRAVDSVSIAANA